jgi:hypothetical protein
MPKGLWVKVDPYQSYRTATGFWVKITPNSWVSVADAWVKVAPDQPYQVFYTAGTAPDSALEIIDTFDSSDRLRLQGVNKHWTPTPTTLQYKFVYIDPYTSSESDITSFTTTTNPSTGSSTILPGTSSYVTIANGALDPYWYPGVLNVYKFRVRGSTASGIYFTSEAEYSFRVPKAPILSFTPASSTSINLTINSYSVDDFIATNRYIVYAYDGTAYRYAGSAGGIVGLGGYSADTQSKTITISGLSTTKSYTFYVIPITGYSGTTDTNTTGYQGLQASIDVQLQATAPSTPVISNITTSTDSLGVKIAFNISLTSTGSSAIDYWEFNLNDGGWQRFNNTYTPVPNGYVFTDSSAEIYVSAGTSYTVRVRATNLDGATSQQSNQLSITSASAPTEPTSVVVKSFTANQLTVFFTAGQNTGSVVAMADYDSVSAFDYLEGYLNISQYNPGKIQLNGANSSSRSYQIYLKPWTGANKTGNEGALTYYANKTPNGSDYMNVSLGTPTLISARNINMQWTLVGGSPTYYIVNLIRYSTGAVVSTKTINETGSSVDRAVSFNESDGVDYGTTYYIQVIPYYQYATGVTYFDATPVSANITTSLNLSAPTPTGVSFTAPSTINVSFSGGSGPYYQLWWATTTGTISGSSFAGYDAAGTGSPISESLSITAGSTYYFWVRSSSENLGNTTQSGTATSGTYSPWSSSYVSYTAPSNATAPTSVSATANSSSSITVSWSGATNATKYRVWYSSSSTGNAVDPSASYDAETTGTSVTFNSLGSSTTYYFWVSASGDNNVWTPYSSSPRGQATTLGNVPSIPTGVSASSNRTDGVLISWNASSGATSYEIWWGGPPLDSYSPDFYPGNTTSYLDTSISAGSSRTYYVRARNSNGASGWSSGATGTRVSAPSGVAPSTPTGLNNSYSSGPSWTGSWSASSGTATITYYWTLYQSTSSGGSITATASGSTTGTSFTRSMSSANGLWAYFTVYASNGFGTSGTAQSSWA